MQPSVASVLSRQSHGNGNGNGRIKLVTVTKRNGNVVPYDKAKIERAIYHCFVNSDLLPATDITLAKAVAVAEQVDHLLPFQPAPVTVEKVQDLVETQLMAMGHYDAAREYILYREEHRKLREERPVDAETRELFRKGCEYFSGPNRAIQIFQALDKFARFDYEKGRREVWIESVDRVMGYCRDHIKTSFGAEAIGAEVWTELRDNLLNLQAAPAMRVVQMAGPALTRCQTGVYNCSFQFLRSPQDMAEEMYLLCQGCGVGFSVEYQHSVDHWPRVKKQRSCKPENLDTFVVPDTTEGWCDAYRTGLEHWLDGSDINFDFSLVRPKGAILKTKGGRASGPQPLKDCLAFARACILAKQGSRLTSLDLHDMACYVHRVSGVGGVRRASGISLSDLDDMEMRNCKSGQFYDTSPHRDQANNSAVYEERPSAIDFMEEWISLGKSGSGERGIFNRGALKKQFPKRRVHKGHVFGTNPCGEIVLRHKQFCVAGNTPLITREGVTTISEVVGQEIEVWNGQGWAKVTPFKTGDNDQLFRVHFSDGSHLDVTSDHGFSVSHMSSRFRGRGFERKTTLELMATLHRRWGTEPFQVQHDGGAEIPTEDVYESGFALGDGFRVGGTTKRVGIDLYGRKDQDCIVRGTKHREYLPQGYNVAKQRVLLELDVCSPEWLYAMRNNPMAFDELFSWSRKSILSFIAGWADADGSETGTGGIRLYLAEYARASRVQLLLTKCGIRSSVCLHQEAGTETNLGVRKRDSYYVQITDCSEIPCRRLNTSGGHKSTMKSKFQTIQRIEPLPGGHASFCFEEPEAHKGVFGNTLTYQCNLSVAVARPHDTWSDLCNKVRLAAIWGTIQSTMTNFSYVSPQWKQNCEEERLLGVDVLGHLDHPMLRPGAVQLPQNLATLQRVAVETNFDWAQRLGINASAAVTCGKPGGDSGVFFDAAPGFKAWHGQYFIRRARVQAENPVAKMLREQGVPCQEDSYKNGLLVLEFPCMAPEGALVLGGQSALEQLEHWKTFKVHYCEHNPSVTIYVKPEEWLAVGHWVYENWDIVGGLAFLPFDGGHYTLPPFETITQEEYDQRCQGFPDIDWSKLVRYESEDMTTCAKQFACTGDKCSL